MVGSEAHSSPLWRTILVATAAEGCLIGGVAAIAGALGGGWSGWIDLLNQFAPVWLVWLLVWGALAYQVVPLGRDRRWLLVITAGGLLASLVMVAPDGVAQGAGALAPASRSPAALKVATLNAWQENPTPERAIRVLSDAGADVVAVQEIYGTLTSRLKLLKTTYPYEVRCPSGLSADLAIYSRLPPITQGCQSPTWATASTSTLSALWVRVMGRDHRPVVVVTTHLSWPMPPGPHEQQSRALSRFVRQFDAREVVLVGDFNTSPWAFSMRRQDRRLRPLVRRTHALFTWPAVIPRALFPTPAQILAIDHLYAARSWTAVSIRRLPAAGSDHYGLVASLWR